MKNFPYILVKSCRLVDTPYEALREESKQKNDVVIELCFGTRHMEFVEEPVNVEEWSREFVKYEV